MRNLNTLAVACFLFVSTASAQSRAIAPTAESIIQPSESAIGNSDAKPAIRELILPAGTQIEIQVAYTVNSRDVKPGERISFRVLVPIVIDGGIVVQEGALVTARVIQSKRGGHWGKGGKLAWSMEDVVAADNSRVILAPETATRSDKLATVESKRPNNETKMGEGKVKGTSHTGEVAAMTIVSGVLFPPLALMSGFKRGENAVLREGRRFVVAVGKDATVRVAVGSSTP